MVIPEPSYINNKLIFIDIQKKDSLIGESCSIPLFENSLLQCKMACGNSLSVGGIHFDF